ncbi:MAG: hypothetical protein ACKOFJ_01220 [Actinomycetota bacterium]
MALAFTSIPYVSEAAVKSGSKCAKLGQISITGGKKYTCIKQGKNLVWSIGKTITQAAPKPSITPTPISSPTPLPSSNPTSTPSPSPTPTATPASNPKAPTSFDDLVENYQGIPYAAWSRAREKILQSTKAATTLKMFVGPNSQLTYKEPLTAIDFVTRLYSSYAQDAEINFLAFNFDDRDWATVQMENIIPNAGNQWIKEVACATRSTCWGGGAFSNGNGKYLVVVALGSLDENHTSGTLEAHEYVHIVQQMNIKRARPPVQFVLDPWPPDWYWEGQAQFAQNAAIYHDSFSTYMRQRSASSGQLFTDSVFKTEHIMNFFVFNAPEDWRKKYERWRVYDLGAMLLEILTAIKGPDATMEIWKIASSGVNFEVAFERVYGVHFSKVLPIISKAIALQLGHEK